MLQLVVWVDDKFLGRSGIELLIAARRIIKAYNLYAHDFSDIDAVPKYGLHQRTVVFHDGGLAGEEAVRLGPPQTKTNT